jgi:hypothetical protein
LQCLSVGHVVASCDCARAGAHHGMGSCGMQAECHANRQLGGGRDAGRDVCVCMRACLNARAHAGRRCAWRTSRCWRSVPTVGCTHTTILPVPMYPSNFARTCTHVPVHVCVCACTYATHRLFQIFLCLTYKSQVTLKALNSVMASRPPGTLFERAIAGFAAGTVFGLDARDFCVLERTCGPGCVVESILASAQVPLCKMQGIWLRLSIGCSCSCLCCLAFTCHAMCCRYIVMLTKRSTRTLQWVCSVDACAMCLF